jgi:hypothetical protein
MASALVISPVALANTTVVYTSGPSTYGMDAWDVSYWGVSNEFTLTQAATITGFTFDAWVVPGDALISEGYSFGSAMFTDSFGSGTAITTGVNDNIPPFYAPNLDTDVDVYTYSASIAPVSLSAGTYFFTLQTGTMSPTSNTNDGINWDENDGSSIGYESWLESNGYGSIGDFDCNVEGYCNVSGGDALTGGETFTFTNTTPEPSSLLLFGTGVVGLAGMLRRKLRI